MNHKDTQPAAQLADCVAEIARFSGANLGSKLSELELRLVGLSKISVCHWLQSASIDKSLVGAARTVKRASAQIDVVLHALGILVLLPTILEKNEIIEFLSLGAGSTGATRFDLETNQRVAEFTFIDWRGNDNTRLQKIFKDFYRLAEFPATKRKELWLSDDSQVLKYLRSGSSVRSATHKHRDVWEDFKLKYPGIETVADYYRLRSATINLRVYDDEFLR